MMDMPSGDDLFSLVLNEDTCEQVLSSAVPLAGKFLWIATADLKDLHVARPGKKFGPFLGVLADLVRDGVDVRLIHAKEPGPRFRKDFDRYPELIESDRFERLLCPRMHMKCVIVDGSFAYIGSANLTGAGMGAKSPLRRNFEAGFVTRDKKTIDELMTFLDSLWIGDCCIKCQRRDVCPDPVC